MHILFLSDNFPPEVNAPASRTFEHCREWVKAGHRVTVITGAPNFPAGKVFDGYRNRLWLRETMAGVEVIRVWTYITANEGLVRRTLDYLSFMVSAAIASLFVRGVDVVVATSPQIFAACAGWAAGAIKRRPFVFELRDLWPESIAAVGALRNARILRALTRLELFLYRRATAIVAVTEAFRQNLISRGVAADKVFVVTNGADLSRFQPRPKDPDLAGRLGLSGKFVAGYIGTHGMAHGLDTILDAAAAIRDRPAGADVRFLLLGDGAEKARLKARAAAEGLDNVAFIDTVLKDEVARYWALLDVSIIHLRNTDLFRTVIPSKLFEGMAMGVPVLHGVEGESAEIVRREGAGVVFEAENPAALVEALLNLAADGAAHAGYRQRAQLAARNYDRTVLARRMLSVLEQLAARRGPVSTQDQAVA
jgi:glycosyltransferase involved in cell wall biosynthesis